MLDVFVNIFLVLTVFLLLSFYLSIISYRASKPSINEMVPQDAKFLKRKVKSGNIDVHPTERALVLNYEVEYTILGENGTEILKEKRDLDKIISLSTLNTKTDCGALAKAVIEKVDLIHPSKLAEIEQLIYYLKSRKNFNRTDSNISRTNSAASVKANTPDNKDCASIIKVEEYIELLYEDIPGKIKGSALILQLAREQDNLDYLSRNEAVLSALARVLREDWKRSIVLSTNLIYTFFCFSTFTTFHSLILHYKIGSLCMDIIDYEISRYEEWRAELYHTETASQQHSEIRKTCPNSASMSEIHRSKIPEPVRPRSGNWTEAFNTNKTIMTGSTYEDLSNSTDNIEEKKQLLSDAEKAKRYRTLIKKQEQLLRVALYLLLNISEDTSVEEKMVKKNIVGLLVKSLERENEDLLILVVTFLKKLSIFEINKDMMANLDVIDKLPKLLQSDNADLVHLTLKLLFNLSFDNSLRNKMVKRGFLPKFVSLLSDERHQTVIIKLLYHLSKDDKVKAMFSYTDCVSLITDMILLFKDDSCNDMIALGINLAIHQNNAEQMVENDRLQNLMKRAFKYQNSLLMKMIRNISDHTSIQPQFLEFIGDLANALTESKQEDFVLECMGVLGNLWLPDLDYSEIFKHFNLIPYFKTLLKPKHCEDDLTLCAIVYIGTVASDKDCAQLLCKSGIMKQLIELLKVHQEDDEIVCQIIYVFLQILAHNETRDHIIMETDAPGYLIDLLQDQNKVVSKVCNRCLDIISDSNPDWARRIQIEKFRNHNAQWLQMVESHAADEADLEDDIGELPPYMNAEYLATHSVPTLADSKDDDRNSLGYESPDILDEFTLSKYDQGLDLSLAL